MGSRNAAKHNKAREDCKSSAMILHQGLSDSSAFQFATKFQVIMLLKRKNTHPLIYLEIAFSKLNDGSQTQK